jgi:hypothetical protein
VTQLRAAEPRAKLADAQLAVAREYGFPSWRKLKAHIEQNAARVNRPTADRIVAAFLQRVGTGRNDDVRAMLAAAPQLVNAVGPHPFWGGRAQALHVPVESKRRKIFDPLLERGADVNGTNDLYDHWSPVMVAINRDQPEMRDEVLRRACGRGRSADAGRRWLHRTAAAGALPDVVPNGGSILAFARTPFAMDRLIALGAPTDLKDRWGSAPIDAMSRLGPRGQVLVQHMIARGVTAAPKEYARLGDIQTLARLSESAHALGVTGMPRIAQSSGFEPR